MDILIQLINVEIFRRRILYREEFSRVPDFLLLLFVRFYLGVANAVIACQDSFIGNAFYIAIF